MATDPDYNISDITAILESLQDNGHTIDPVSDYEIYKLFVVCQKNFTRTR